MGLSYSHIPNILSIGRMLLVIPIIFGMLAGDYGLALALIFVAATTDALDGFLARRYDWRTRLGGILDPAADKLLMVSVYIAFGYLGLVSIPIVGLVLVRDVVIVSGVTLYWWRSGYFEAAPRAASKLNTLVSSLFALTVVAQAAWEPFPQLVLIVFGALLVTTTVVSGLDYVLSWGRQVLDRELSG